MDESKLSFAVSEAQVAAARRKLLEAGFDLVGDVGVIERDSYRIGYQISGGVLVLALLAKPRFVPAGVVRAKIRSLLGSQGIVEIA